MTDSGDIVVVSMVRAGDPDKAERTLESLRRELTYGDVYEFRAGEFASLSALAPNAWVIERRNRLDHDSLSGASRGAIAIWVVSI